MGFGDDNQRRLGAEKRRKWDLSQGMFFKDHVIVFFFTAVSDNWHSTSN
jgi:hypothetical protein